MIMNRYFPHILIMEVLCNFFRTLEKENAIDLKNIIKNIILKIHKIQVGECEKNDKCNF